MLASYRIPADELNAQILKSIKSAFRGKEIEILVSEVDNSSVLIDRIKQLKESKDIVSFTPDQFSDFVNQKS
jgi:hypothetical protein